MILGVCSWIAEKMDVSATVVRVAFVVAFFAGLIGLPAYIIAWIIKLIVD